MSYDAVVIGAGLSGLTSALLLARSGRKVIVAEQHHAPAPVVSGFERDGSFFDSGFHYAGGLDSNGPLQPLLRHLGLTAKLQLFSYNPAGFDRLRILASGAEYILPVGLTNIRHYLAGKFPAATVEIDRYLDEISSNWCNSPYLDLTADFSDFGSEPVHGCSLFHRLEVFSRWPELQSLLSMHSLLYGVDPEHAPLALNSHVVGSYYQSASGIVGGGRRLIQALVELAAAAGVEFKCRAEVMRILVEKGAASGVRLRSGETLSAPTVIATVNPVLLPDLLPDSGLRPVYLKRLRALRQTFSAYIVFGKSPQSLEFLRRQNMFVQRQAGIFSGFDRRLEERPFYLAGADQGRRGEITGLIGIVPAHFSEVVGWNGPGKKRTAEYRDWKKGIGERLLKILRNSCPQLANMELVDLATPLTLRDYSMAPEGAVYGVGRLLGQYNPAPVTRLPGLLLAGQGVSVCGLMGTLISGYMACGSILGHEFLRGELKKWR